MAEHRRLLVMHASYGCDTGCCGHVIKYADTAEQVGAFDFGGCPRSSSDEDRLAYAQELITDELGARCGSGLGEQRGAR